MAEARNCPYISLWHTLTHYQQITSSSGEQEKATPSLGIPEWLWVVGCLPPSFPLSLPFLSSLPLPALPLLVLFPFPFFSFFFSWSSSEAYHHPLGVFFALQPSHKAKEFVAWSLSVKKKKKKKSFLSGIFITGRQEAAFLLKKMPHPGLSTVTLAVTIRGCFSSLWTKSYNPKMLKMK